MYVCSYVLSIHTHFDLMSLFMIKKLSQIGENINLKVGPWKHWMSSKKKKKKEIDLFAINNKSVK